MIGRIAIIGVGLLGSSFALALKNRNQVSDVVGLDRDPAVLGRALALGIIDRAARDLPEALLDTDLVLLAVPVAQTEALLCVIAEHLDAATVITDTGSTKGTIVDAARRALGQKIGQFVPAHPLTGGERHGPEAARADLFTDQKVVLTPLAENEIATVECVRGAWQMCGARTVTLEATEHDRMLAAVSHLPHLLAYAFFDQIAGASDGPAKLSLAGKGLRDFTRIAASSPEMWRDITLANRAALLWELDDYLERLQSLRRDIDASDGDALKALFARASVARLEWDHGR